MTENKPIFDQHGQKVVYQYNAAGDINFGSIQVKEELITELRKLINEIGSASNAGAINQETAIEVEANIKKAIVQAEKTNPSRNAILENLEKAKSLIDGLTSAAGLISAFIQAAEMVRKFF